MPYCKNPHFSNFSLLSWKCFCLFIFPELYLKLSFILPNPLRLLFTFQVGLSPAGGGEINPIAPPPPPPPVFTSEENQMPCLRYMSQGVWRTNNAPLVLCNISHQKIKMAFIAYLTLTLFLMLFSSCNILSYSNADQGLILYSFQN